MTTISIDQSTLGGAKLAYECLLYEFTKRPLTIEDTEVLSFLAQPLGNESIALWHGQPTRWEFLSCAKHHKPLDIDPYYFSSDCQEDSTRKCIDHFPHLCEYAMALRNSFPTTESPLGLDGCAYTPTFDSLIEYPSLLSQGIQEGFTWVKDPEAVHSLVKSAVFQRSIEGKLFGDDKYKTLPYCYVDYGEVVDHAKSGDKVWVRKLFSQHSCVVIEFTGGGYNFAGARAVLQGIHWYAFRRDEDRPEYLLNNGATRFAKTQVILSSPNIPFEGLDVSKLSAFEKFFTNLDKPASPATLLNLHTYDCEPICEPNTDNFNVIATCASLPSWFGRIVLSLKDAENDPNDRGK